MRTIADSYREEWRAEGMKEGVAQGVAQGASKNTIEIACRMIQENVDIRFISSITKLTQKEILKIKKRVE